MTNSIKIILSILVAITTLLANVTSSHAQASTSLFSVDLSWKDEAGKPVTFSKFKDHYVIITMAYTACSLACPLTIERLRGIEKKLGQNAAKVEFAIITFDPERDTPSALADYKEKRNLKSSHWHFLSGTEQDTRMLAHLLEIAYEKNPTTNEIMHSNKITLLDPAGNIKTVLEGLNSNTDELVQAIQ